MTNREIEKLLDRMVKRIPDWLEHYLGPGRNVCILATRIATHVLAELRVPARPQACGLIVCNEVASELTRKTGRLQPEVAAEVEEWVAAGARTVIVGFGSESERPGYDGHLVAVVRERWLLDLTFDQVNRPDKGIVVDPIFYGGSEVQKWARGPVAEYGRLDPAALLSIAGHHEEAGVRVSAHYIKREDQSYRDSIDWRNIDRHHLLVRKAKELIA